MTYPHGTPHTHHAHMCPNPNCQFVWDHDPDAIDTREEFVASHHCPKCGTEQITPYRGTLDSQAAHTGVGYCRAYTGNTLPCHEPVHSPFDMSVLMDRMDQCEPVERLKLTLRRLHAMLEV